jgi:hypothetical protein
MPTRFSEILNAFEFVSSDGGGEKQALLCQQTGKIYYRSEDAGIDELSEEMPDDVGDEEKYIAIPNKRDLDLGRPLVMDFVREFLPGDVDEVRHIFGKRGAYHKFKALLSRRKALDRWYDFEAKATERALREWCERHSIAVTD